MWFELATGTDHLAFLSDFPDGGQKGVEVRNVQTGR